MPVLTRDIDHICLYCLKRIQPGDRAERATSWDGEIRGRVHAVGCAAKRRENREFLDRERK